MRSDKSNGENRAIPATGFRKLLRLTVLDIVLRKFLGICFAILRRFLEKSAENEIV
ncbi:MAG: hypothetical protein IKJ59_14275 [Clostridia bacterium]|nr:hypothetical protein [Clostridia bacterium]